MLLDVSMSQLVLVDYQERVIPSIFEGHEVFLNGVRLAKLGNLFNVPTFGVEQNPSKLGGNLLELKVLCSQTLSKMQFSAVEEGLGEWLRPHVSEMGNTRSIPKHLKKPINQNKNTIVISGCEAHVCLMQTALDLIEEEFDVWVVTDACGSRTERNRDAAFDRLASAGAELLTTEMVAFEWLRSAEHDHFHAVQKLIK